MAAITINTVTIMIIITVVTLLTINEFFSQAPALIVEPSKH